MKATKNSHAYIQLLHDIARRSRGGTYHNAGHSDDTNNQIRHVAKVLAILHDVSALDLTVTLKPRAGATILELKPGNYPKTYGETDGFPIINFGELAREEHRKILVVPPVLKDEKAKNVMTVEWSYRYVPIYIAWNSCVFVYLSLSHTHTRRHKHTHTQLARLAIINM
jgi:hypothetical protein